MEAKAAVKPPLDLDATISSPVPLIAQLAVYCLLHREVRMKKTWCSMNEKNANYIHANRYPVAAAQNTPQHSPAEVTG